MNKKQRRKQRQRRRNQQPQKIGKIIEDEFPEYLPSDKIKITTDTERKIVSFQCKDGLPMSFVQALFGISTNSRKHN